MSCQYLNVSNENVWIDDTDSFFQADLFDVIEAYAGIIVGDKIIISNEPGSINCTYEIHTNKGIFNIRQILEGFEDDCEVRIHSSDKDIMKIICLALEKSNKFIERQSNSQEVSSDTNMAPHVERADENKPWWRFW